MTQRLARLALAAAATAALAAPASATLPEDCTGTTHRCVQYVKDLVCPNVCA